MYSFPDVEGTQSSDDDDASGDLDRHFSGHQVDPALSLDFFESMRKLKEGNERTLDMCNSLCYQGSHNDEEQEESGEFESGSDHGQPHIKSSKSAPLFIGSDRELLNKSVGSMQNILAKNAKDSVRDFATADGALTNPKTSKGVRLDPRPRIRCFEASLSENDDSEYERYKENRAATIHNDTLQSAMAQIEDMWGAFTIEDYAPWTSFRQTTNIKGNQSQTKIDAESRPNTRVATEWKRKTTVPDPPTMLLRDANKTPKKTKAMIELDKEREERKQLEEMECRKQFRARAAPEHVRLRLLDEMNRNQEQRRQLLRENGEEILKSAQRPFEFTEREERKKRERMKELERCSNDRNGHFRAKPFPAHIFDGTVEDKILEEEEYRRIRMRIRAEELLNSSTVPYSMRVRDRRPRKTEEAPREESFRPRVNRTIPDLDEQYQRFMEQMMKRKEGKRPTACKPFNLRLSKTAARRRAFLGGESMEAGRLSRQRSLGNEHAKGSLSLSLEAIPTQLREEKRKASTHRSKRKRSLAQKTGCDDRWGVLPGDVVYPLDDSDDLVRSGGSPTLNQAKFSKQKQSDLGFAHEGNYRLAPSSSDRRLNQTFERDASDRADDASERAPSDFWSHPSLVRRSEFWSNPVTSVH